MTADKRRESDGDIPRNQTRSKKEATKKSKTISTFNELQAATSSSKHRLWTRSVVVIAVAVLVYFYAHNISRETKFASAREKLPLREQKFKCSSSYESEIQEHPLCMPQKCGRFVTDELAQPLEVDTLLDLARRIISKGGSSGGASILDIHTGALSYKQEFINVYNIPNIVAEFQDHHLKVYNLVKGKIKLAIAERFGIPSDSLYLTYPTFFSRITNETAKTLHDEYWHEHVDKDTYPSFHYTSLLYLNTYNKNFKGGRFLFIDGVDKNRTTSAVEPREGRVIAFTSGEENRHHVEKVTEGERYAITISFTCNKNLGIGDPEIKNPEETR